MSYFPSAGPALDVDSIDPQGWDKCVIGRDTLPGHARIESASLQVKVDRKSKPGANVKRPTLFGIDEQPVIVDLKIFNDIDREKFAAICERIKPTGKRDPQPFVFDHASVRHLDITSVLVVKIHALVLVSPNVTTCKIELLDWRASPKNPRNATKTALHKLNSTGPKPDAKPENPTPVDQGAAAGSYGVLL